MWKVYHFLGYATMALRDIHTQLKTVLTNQEKMMAQLDDLLQKETDTLTFIGTLTTDFNTALADLKAQVPATVDLTPALAKFDAISSALSTFDASIKAADPGTTVTTPVAVTPAA